MAVVPLKCLFKKGEKKICYTKSSWNRRVRICERSSPEDTKVSGEGWEASSASGTGTEIPLKLVMETRRELCPCSPWRSVVEERSTCRTCGVMETRAHTGADFLAGLVSLQGETHAGAACSWKTALHRRITYWMSLWRTSAPGKEKDPCWRRLWRTDCCGKNPMLEQGKSVRRKEQQRQHVITMHRESTAFIPCCPVPLWGWR